VDYEITGGFTLSKIKKCRKGHLMTAENSYQRKDGYMACRECMLEADKRYRDREQFRARVKAAI
jgi:hypothetical protein